MSPGHATSNYRNGSCGERVTDDGPFMINVPRDRQATFEPQLIPKHARRFTGVDDKTVVLYGRGLTVREIQPILAKRMRGRCRPT